ncbi:MAG: hypothetical protein NPIRA05_13030 [Nitrospirales bacterium]|nr:MAG: hypothetical protein NPIRA05_13030 [Nitrospirales bacterium]
MNASNVEQDGIVIFDPVDSGGGDITITVTSASNNSFATSDLTGNLAVPLSAGSGNIVVTADEIDLFDFSPVSGTGNLTLQSFTASQGITLGGTAELGVNTLDLIDEELNAIQDGFNSITIGRGNGSGLISVDPAGISFSDPVTLQSPGVGGAIVANGPIQTNGNDLTLNSGGDIQVDFINAQGVENFSGGSVDITTDRFFRATGSFIDRNGTVASISTADFNGGRDITIRHGGGDRGVAFTVGDPLLSSGPDRNGTAAAISSGDFSISPIKSLPFTFAEGNIQIIGLDEQKPAQNDPGILIDPPIVIPDPEKPPLQLPDPEEPFTNDFENYLDIRGTPIKTLDQIRAELREIEDATGVKPAVIYAMFTPTNPTLPSEAGGAARTHKQLELVLVTSSGLPVRQRIEGATRRQVITKARQFRKHIKDIKHSPPDLSEAQQFYAWLIAPLKGDLQAHEIDQLVFVMDTKLRSIPVAALHDGQEFIIEQYSVGLMPSLSLTDTRYRDIRKLEVLAMGAQTFLAKGQSPLTAVPTELEAITGQLWKGKQLLDEDFTPEILREERNKHPRGILHLATHADFRPGKPSNSYIQLWGDNRLQLNQLRELKLYDPPVELMTLSACRTALGDREAELGFSGLAAQAGVKSAMGSLWKVSDTGTLGLMTSFYEKLRNASTKATALQQAQLAMLHGGVRREHDKLKIATLDQPQGELILNLPPSKIIAAESESKTAEQEVPQSRKNAFSHPYYWSGFTIIGNPW